MQKLLYFSSVDTKDMSWAQCMNKFQEEEDWHKAKEYLQDGMEKRTVNLRNHSKLVLGKRLRSDVDGSGGSGGPSSDARREGESATALAFHGSGLPVASVEDVPGSGPRRSKRMRMTDAGEEEEDSSKEGGGKKDGSKDGAKDAGKEDKGGEDDSEPEPEEELTEEEELDRRAIFELGVAKHTYKMTLWGRSYAYGLVQTMNMAFLDKASMFEGSHAPAYLMCELLFREHNAVSYCMNTKDWRTGFEVMLATIIAMGEEFYWTFTDDLGEMPCRVLEDLAKVWTVIVRKLAVFPPGRPDLAIITLAELADLDYAWDELASKVNEASLPVDVSLLNKFALAKAQTRIAIEKDKPAVVKPRMCRHCNVPLKGHRSVCPVMSARKASRQMQKDSKRKAKSVLMLKQFYDMHVLNGDLDSNEVMAVNAVIQHQLNALDANQAAQQTAGPAIPAASTTATPDLGGAASSTAPAVASNAPTDIAVPPAPAPAPASGSASSSTLE